MSGPTLSHSSLHTVRVAPRPSSPPRYVRRLERADVDSLLCAAQLGGLVDTVVDAIEQLRGAKAASSAELNDKFQVTGSFRASDGPLSLPTLTLPRHPDQVTGKFQASYGSLSLFYGGLESLIGPPQMVKDPERGGLATLFKAMENEHTQQSDARELFTSSNGITTTSSDEWEVATPATPSPLPSPCPLPCPRPRLQPPHPHRTLIAPSPSPCFTPLLHPPVDRGRARPCPSA